MLDNNYIEREMTIYKLLTTFFLLSLLSINIYAQNSYTINTSGNTFFPSSLTIAIGDTVTWVNTGGFHNINATQATFPTNPQGFGNAVAGAGWAFQWVFTIAGTYNYQCDPHAGMGMTGVVIVNPLLPAINNIVTTNPTCNGYNDGTCTTYVSNPGSAIGMLNCQVSWWNPSLPGGGGWSPSNSYGSNNFFPQSNSQIFTPHTA